MIGLDAEIEDLRVELAARLFTSLNYSSYGRAYKNIRDEQTVPEILLSGSNEYQEVLLDDTKDAISFFIVEEDYEVLHPTKVKGVVNIYFAVNLKTIYPLVSERATEYLHKDVLNVIKISRFESTKITSGLESFSDFDVFTPDNMQPFYLVRFTAEIEYNINEC